MKVLITEKQKSFLYERISNTEELNEKPTKYTYTHLGSFEKGSTKRYYFNNIVPVEDLNPIPSKIKIEGKSGDFAFDENKLFINNEKKNISINKSDFYSKYPDHKKENKSEQIGITPKSIRLALEKAFPKNWKDETDMFSAGLRGVYTIGDKLGNSEEDWSVMNYFDTKEEIHSLIYLKYFDDKPTGDIIDWMADLFRNNEEFTKLLVDRQWKSIEGGLKLERESVNNFIDKLNVGNITYYPHGSKMDRWYGVDVTINGVNYQIKPLKSYKEVDGEYTIGTYGMMDYKNKKLVDKIVFSKNDEILIFDNKNYTVVSKSVVIFSEKPEILK